MKKIIAIMSTVILTLCFSYSAQARSISGGVIAIVDNTEEIQNRNIDIVNINVSKCISKENGDGIEVDRTYFFRTIWEKRVLSEITETTKELIFSNMGENELVSAIVLKSTDITNPFPEIEPIEIKFYVMESIGGSERVELFGKDYRLYYLDDGQLIEMQIIESDEQSAKFEADKLGYYVLYYNPHIYNVEFYEEYPENREEVFYVDEGLKRYDDVEFPEIPTREGYVFTGWKYNKMQGRYDAYFYVGPAPVKTYSVWDIYASWCPEEEYIPLEVMLASNKIIKGKEDGAEITLTLSEGKFAETLDDDIENDWKIVGNDELTVASVERIDDTTVKLVLSGNSSDKYKTGEIQVEFNSELYISHEGFGDNNEVHEVADIQLDENGIKKAMFVSDNSITLEKQKRSGGNGGGTAYYSVKFNTNGGEEIGNVQVERNEVVAEPAVPVRDGFVFKGWYANAELTEKYDFETKVTESFTLYAAWEEDETKKIVLTVGEKKAIVFGKEVTNDVAPVIKNNRVMLPIRFIAESLGAEVLWSADAPDEVKIAKDGTEIVIFIGGDYALVNGEKINLDSSAFLENDRTYLPIRFVAESLGCTVEWNDETKSVKIGVY